MEVEPATYKMSSDAKGESYGEDGFTGGDDYESLNFKAKDDDAVVVDAEGDG